MIDDVRGVACRGVGDRKGVWWAASPALLLEDWSCRRELDISLKAGCTGTSVRAALTVLLQGCIKTAVIDIKNGIQASVSHSQTQKACIILYNDSK